MKTISTTLIMFFFALSVFAQTSVKTFSFQGYAIDPNGKALASTSITAKFTVYDTGGSGASYSEEQTMSTDAFGVFTALIGTGTPADFKKLNFTAVNASFKLKVEVKKAVAGTYTTINDATMSAVPYARYADNGVPVGTIVAFAGPKTKIPAGWLACDGTSYDGAAADYVQLYAVIGSSWGSSGGTAFNVPDLRGQFLRGVDETAGVDEDKTTRTAKTGGNSANNVGSYQVEGFKGHNHTLTDPGHSHSYNDVYWMEAGGTVAVGSNGGSAGGDNDNNGYQFARTSGASTTGITIAPTGGNETRPDNAYVNYIIKY